MAVKGVTLTVNFYAYDTANNTGKTGDSANFTLRLVKDGGAAAAPTNAASISEPDSTNMPGVYEIVLTAEEMAANFVTLHGKSSTANIILQPLFIITNDTFAYTGITAGASTSFGNIIKRIASIFGGKKVKSTSGTATIISHKDYDTVGTTEATETIDGNNITWA